ncbi:hypothetical protein C3B55_00886 [Candidatus Pseudomonas adelgestsugas]|uniref:Uncharacterized protein n=1 Tax=Candidatus Pseudomonas adelgestsugas TaxID=1302376 RepID=A0ABX5R965_9PSED|nr:hypothetical protein C3B55_00886 [Candidatus Pseudomonas adelgestsugas]
MRKSLVSSMSNPDLDFDLCVDTRAKHHNHAIIARMHLNEGSRLIV